MPILGANSSGGSRPSAPVIGAATDGGTGTTASVAFTPSTYIGKGTINYTVTSSPGNITASGASSPITVSGLTTGTAYTFTVQGTTNYGVSSAVTSASNSVTPAVPSSFESIATLSGNGVYTVTFSSIPSTYKSLQIRCISQKSTGTDQFFTIAFNGDTSSTLYDYHQNYGDGSSGNSSGNTNQSYDGALIGYTMSSGSHVGATIIDIMDYANTNKIKTAKSQTGFSLGSASNSRAGWLSVSWRNTNAVNSVSLYSPINQWGSNSTFALYGIK